MSEIKVNQEVLNKAKSWEIGTVRSTQSGKRILVLSPGVKITVGDREVDLGEYNSLFFDAATDVIAFNERLVSENKTTTEKVENLKSRINQKNITQILRAKLK